MSNFEVIVIDENSEPNWTEINPVGGTTIREDECASVYTVDGDGVEHDIVIVNDMGIVKVYRNGVQMVTPEF